MLRSALCLEILFYLHSILIGISSTTEATERKCFKPNRREYSIQRLGNYVDGPSRCNPDWSPDAPSSPSLVYNCNTGSVELRWRANKHFLSQLGGFLLHVEKEINGPRISTYYLQVNVTEKQTKREHFSYRCFDVTSVNVLNIWIWTLSRRMEKCKKVFRSIFIHQEKFRCSAKMCVCKSMVTIQPVISHVDQSIHGIITVTNLPAGTPVTVSLEQDNGTVHQTWETVWTKNQTRFFVQSEFIPTGTYFFRVFRHCKMNSITSSPCNKYEPHVIKSSEIYMNTSRQDNVKGILEDHNGSGHSSLILLITMSASLIFILVAIFTWSITYKLGICLFRQKTQHRFGNAQRIYHQIQGEGARKKVALIFAKDSPVHCRRVYRLTAELNKNGLEAVPVDEQTNKEMMMNWIDVGEGIPNRFDVLLFIMSPILYELCHRDGTGIAELTRAGHILHRLPAAVLHALRVKPYYRGGNMPKAFVVSLDRTAKESNPMIKAFLKEYKTVFHPTPVFLNDMSAGIKRLLKTINVRSVSIV